MIKILLGGSPCTFWSIAQKNNRETEAEGLGWELFKNYLIAKEKFKPDLFLYENNKSASQPIKDQISRELGVDLMYINSALVSAQNRQRFYAFNWKVEQPEDRGLLLRDILESGVTDREKARCVTASVGRTTHREYFLKQQNTVSIEPVVVGYRNRREDDGKLYRRFETHGEEKANCLTTVQTDSMVAEPLYVGEIPEHKGTYRNGKQPLQQYRVFSADAKGVAVTTCAITNVAQPVRVGTLPRKDGEVIDHQQSRIYSVDAKSTNLNANGGGQGAKTGLYAVPAYYPYAEPTEWDENGKPTKAKSGADGKDHIVYEVVDGIITIKDKQYPIKLPDGFYIIRKLTPVECERLQTLPDGYTSGVSDAQRYKGLGNGWTAEVIIHILNGALKDVPRDEEIVVLSMYDGIGTGRYCLDAMGFTNVTYFAYEIDKFAKQISMKNYPDITQCGDAFDIRHPDWTIGY